MNCPCHTKIVGWNIGPTSLSVQNLLIATLAHPKSHMMMWIWYWNQGLSIFVTPFWANDHRYSTCRRGSPGLSDMVFHFHRILSIWGDRLLQSALHYQSATFYSSYTYLSNLLSWKYCKFSIWISGGHRLSSPPPIVFISCTFLFEDLYIF